MGKATRREFYRALGARVMTAERNKPHIYFNTFRQQWTWVSKAMVDQHLLDEASKVCERMNAAMLKKQS